MSNDGGVKQLLHDANELLIYIDHQEVGDMVDMVSKQILLYQSQAFKDRIERLRRSKLAVENDE
jgi:hypothetical protein